MLILWITNLATSDLFRSLSLGIILKDKVSKVNVTEKSIFVRFHLKWGSCMRYVVTPCGFHCTRHHLLGRLGSACCQMTVLEAQRLLIGCSWSKPDSKSINYTPLASGLPNIKGIFWTQFQNIKRICHVWGLSLVFICRLFCQNIRKWSQSFVGDFYCSVAFDLSVQAIHLLTSNDFVFIYVLLQPAVSVGGIT